MTEKEFNLLFHNWFEPVRRYLFYRCGRTDLATDLAQEAFIRVWEKNSTTDEKVTAGLVYKIARDLLLSHFRREKVRLNYEGKLQLHEPAGSPEEDLMYNELVQTYNELLIRMPEKLRTVFLLSRIDELKYTEIAGCMGISVKAVEKRMTQALKLLRRELNAYGKH